MKTEYATKREISKLCELTHDLTYLGRKLSRTWVLNKINRISGNDLTYEARKKKMAKGLYEYLMNNIDKVVESIYESIGIKSTIVDDPEYFGDTKKSWTMIGRGCGIVTIKNYKTYENAKAVYSVSLDVLEKFYKKVFVRIPLKTRRSLTKIGCPLEAIMNQDIDIQTTCMNLVCDYMRQVSGKNFKGYVESRLD